MKKRKRAPKLFVAKKAGVVLPAPSRNLPSMRFGLATLAVLLFSVIGAAATNNIYHGHVVVTQDRAKSPTTGHSDLNSKTIKAPVPAQSAVSNKPASDIVVKYGPAAKSALVAMAIKKLEFIAPVAGAKLAADKSEALERGCWRPGANPTEAIMYGLVPPGMSQEHAAILAGALPKMPRAPEPMTPERIARMAGEPADPMDAVLQGQGLPRNQINAQNDREFRSYMRERNGPIYMPPLHRDHQGSIREMLDGSGNIVAQYAYDPYGQATKLQGSMDSDFQYAGYYYHAPSGLSFTLNRAYSPTLGRWINRDPIHDLAFMLRPRSPEPKDPGAQVLAAASGPTASLRLLGHDPMIRAQLRKLNIGGQRRSAQQWNDYAYVANSPVNFNDPSGLAAIGMPIPLPIPIVCHKGKHPPHPGDPGTQGWDHFDCVNYCANENLSYADYLDCLAECQEWWPGYSDD